MKLDILTIEEIGRSQLLGPGDVLGSIIFRSAREDELTIHEAGHTVHGRLSDVYLCLDRDEFNHVPLFGLRGKEAPRRRSVLRQLHHSCTGRTHDYDADRWMCRSQLTTEHVDELLDHRHGILVQLLGEHLNHPGHFL